MGIFKKKKVEEVKKEDDVKTEVADASIGDKVEKKEIPKKEIPKPELTAEEKELLERIRAFKKYSGVFSANDYANLPEVALRSEEANLQFAILAELQDLNKRIDALISLARE